MQRIGNVFAKMAVATALGLAAGTLVPAPILVASLIFLAGGRMILKRRKRSRFAHLALHFGSNSRRRAA